MLTKTDSDTSLKLLIGGSVAVSVLLLLASGGLVWLAGTLGSL